MRDLLKDARQAKGLSLGKLSLKTGLAKSYLWGIENGTIKDPSIYKIKTISKALGVSWGSVGKSLN